MRRYFDEYRGLRETVGHVEDFSARATVRAVRSEVAGDDAYLAQQGAGRAARLRWTTRSAAHHAGRRVFSALGSRSDRLPGAAQRALSLEGRATDAAPAAGVEDAVPAEPSLQSIAPRRPREMFAEILDAEVHGSAPLLAPAAGMAALRPLAASLPSASPSTAA